MKLRRRQKRTTEMKSALRSKRLKVIGIIGLAGGAGAAILKKVKADKPPVYSGPAPSVAVDAAASAPDAPSPPLAVAPDPVPHADETPAAGASALHDGGDAGDSASDEPAAGDDAADAPDGKADAEEPAADATADDDSESGEPAKD